MFTTFNNRNMSMRTLPGCRAIVKRWMPTTIAAVGAIATAVVTMTMSMASAVADPMPDTTFGPSHNGRVITAASSSTWDTANAVSIQPDGKIVAVGFSTLNRADDFFVARYNSDGSLDNTFGPSHDGKLVSDLGGNDVAYSIVIQNDGKLVVAGFTDAGGTQDFAIARYNSDGSPDSYFGPAHDGKVITDFSLTNEVVQSVKLQQNGMILAAGYSYSGANYDIAVARYNSDGTADSYFGPAHDGKVSTNIQRDDEAYGMVVQADGKIAVAGFTSTGTVDDAVVVRYNPDGSLDTGFGSGGHVRTRFGSNATDLNHFTSFGIQNDGKLVAVGFRCDSSYAFCDFAVARYTEPNGSLDPAFGNNGLVTTDINQNTDEAAYAMAIQTDGKIVAAGYINAGADNDFALIRYLSDGSPDPTFGTNGVTTTDINAQKRDLALALAIQTDGKIVAAGLTHPTANDNFALVRYNPSSTPTTTSSTTTSTTIATTTTVASTSTNATTTVVATTSVATTTMPASTTTSAVPWVAPSDKTIRALEVKPIVTSLNVQAGSTISVAAGGFSPNETVVVGILGIDSSLTSTTANATGRITTKLSVPANANREITVYAFGQSSNRGLRQVVEVKRISALPTTGSNSARLSFLGITMLAAGLVLAVRRRLTC